MSLLFQTQKRLEVMEEEVFDIDRYLEVLTNKLEQLEAIHTQGIEMRNQ